MLFEPFCPVDTVLLFIAFHCSICCFCIVTVLRNKNIYLVPLSGVTPVEFHRGLRQQKTTVPGCRGVLFA